MPRCHLGFYCLTDVAQAEREMRAFVEGYYASPYEVMVRDQRLCAGSAEACGKWWQGFIAAGVGRIRFGGPDQVGQLERRAKEVLPRPV
jgi:hypothetical protein